MNADEGHIQIIIRIFLEINYFNFALCDLFIECSHIIFYLDILVNFSRLMFCRIRASSIM